MPSESEPPGLQNNLLSPLLTGTESPFDLEQQWQDLMSIMEMQVGSPEQDTNLLGVGQWVFPLSCEISLLWEEKGTVLSSVGKWGH